MSALSLRLPDDIDARLGAEARLEGKSRSEIARLAIAEYLTRHEKARFMAEMVASVKAMADDPEVGSESLEIANDLVDEGIDRLIEEDRAAGIDPNLPWWR